MGLAPTISILIIGRFIVGVSNCFQIFIISQLGVGIGAMVVPFYLGEASPIEIRGKIIACNVLFITTGQFISYLVCIALGNKWRWMLGIAAVPSIIQLFGMLFMPETPVYLYKSNLNHEADLVLDKLYLPQFVESKKAELRSEVENIRLECRDPLKVRLK
jgi:MFS transporter, SP family, solute carrier family 2 (myo-inositol transporter), member 13